MFHQFLNHHRFSSLQPSALLFPAVSPRRRFLIHNTVQENFPQLTTLSVGQGEQRRTAVTFKRNLGEGAAATSPEKGEDERTSCIATEKRETAVYTRQGTPPHHQQPRGQHTPQHQHPRGQHTPQHQHHRGQQNYQQQQSRGQQNHQHSQPRGQQTPQQQDPPKKEERSGPDRPQREGRRPEQLLYSPQRQSGLQPRTEQKREGQHQQNNRGNPYPQSDQQQQQQQQGSGTNKQRHQQINQELRSQQQQQPSNPASATQEQKQKQPQQQKQEQRPPKEEEQWRFDPERQQQHPQPQRQQQHPQPQRHQQHPQPQRQRKNRSRSCNSEKRNNNSSNTEVSQSIPNPPTNTRDNITTLETTPVSSHERLGYEDDLMRDSGAEESHQQQPAGRKRRNRRNRRQPKDPRGPSTPGGTSANDNNNSTEDSLLIANLSGKSEREPGRANRQSRSVQNLSVSNYSDNARDRGGGVENGGDVWHYEERLNAVNGKREEVYNNRGFNNAAHRKFGVKSPEEPDTWRDTGTNHLQDRTRSPVCSRKEEFREEGPTSFSGDNVAKISPERMPVTAPQEQGNSRRRGKAPAQIYRPPPARSSRDVPPQHHQPVPQHQPQIQSHHPVYSQPYMPKNFQYPQQQQHNYIHQQEFHQYQSLPNRQRTDSESSTATTPGDNRGKGGRRPDQVLYIPRGRRHMPTDPPSARGTPTPMMDYDNNGRPPSPAYSICSVASEYSGQNRYNKQGSRQGSQISIYESEADRLQSKPPVSRDLSRESTPGYGKQKAVGGRFNSHQLQLIERCLNHESENRCSSEYSNGVPDEPHNSPSRKNNRLSGGRAQKSPTPTREFHSIHSKENVNHQVEPSPRSRRSRKNRRRNSNSRESSADHYNGGKNTSYNSDYNNSPGERGALGSCERIFYNSNFNSSHDRYDRGYDNYDRYSSINSSRASSRNSSRERTPQYSPQHNWRVGSSPSSPTKSSVSFHQNRQSPGKPPSGRLGSLPNVALDFGESPKRVSNHNEENHRYHTLPVKSRNHVKNSSLQTAKENIEYGSGCIVSDRLDTCPSNEIPQPLTQANDLIIQNDNSIPEHNEETVVENKSDPSHNSLTFNEEVNNKNNTQVETVSPEDSNSPSNLNDNSLNDSGHVTDSGHTKESFFTEAIEISKKSNDSDAKDVSYSSSPGKSVDGNLSGTASEEDVYEVEKSMNESVKDSTEEIMSSDNDTKDSPSENIYKDSEKEMKNPKKFQFNWADEEEDSWDNLYDDNGECLDPEIKRQLSDSFGKIKLEKPANDYYSFQPRDNVDINEDEYAHVIEIYDFPVSFKTQDLLTVFGSFQNSGFDIKWVDDTHALGIFATSLIAAEALSIDHPFLKTRSLSLATKSSKAKAMRITEALLPYKPRPATSASLARRFISGALGLKVNIPREVREAEKQKLKDAKAQKRLAAKQRADAWEGTIAAN